MSRDIPIGHKSAEMLMDEICDMVNELNRLREIACHIDLDVLSDDAMQKRITDIRHDIAKRLSLIPAGLLLDLQVKLGMIAIKEPDNEHQD